MSEAGKTTTSDATQGRTFDGGTHPGSDFLTVRPWPRPAILLAQTPPQGRKGRILPKEYPREGFM
jgi:hypothetical protein